MAKPGLTSSFGLFTKSKELVLKNGSTFALLLLLPFLSGLFSSIRTRDVQGFERFTSNASSPNFGLSSSALGVGVLLGLVLLAVSIIANLMLYVLSLEASKDKKPGIKELWPVVQKYGVRLVLLSILIVIVIMLGLLALIIPGIIFIRRYYLAPYVMLDQDLSITESMKESARISKPYPISIWGILGVTFVLSLPGIVPVFGWAIAFVLTSLYTVAPALRYLELKKLTPKTAA